MLEVRVDEYETLCLEALINMEIQMSRVVVYVRSDVIFNRRIDSKSHWMGRLRKIGKVYRLFEFCIIYSIENFTLCEN